MPSLDYLHKHREFKELLRTVSFNQGILTDLVEKDYWIMHCLYSLKQQGYQFELKGGTSLSKGFNIIHRFSEDIDLRIAPPKPSNVETNPKKTKPAHCESRKTYYDQLAAEISIDGVHQIERDHEFDDTRYYRSGGIRLSYIESFPVSPGVKQGVLLEVGFDVVTPNIQQTISSWALDFALDNELEVINNSAEAIPCYHPGFTFVEKLQTIATKFRQQQETQNLPSNLMRHYYDVACLLEHPEVQDFIGTEDYERHKIDRFPKLDLKVSISHNEAFLLSDRETRELYRKSYEKTVALYYQDQPPFEEILGKIHRYIERF